MESRPSDGISFTTDYGTADGFVAACKGVIATIAPGTTVLDVTHQIPPGDIRRGAVVLAQTLPYLPPAVHLAVVDPGVGTARRPVAVQTPASILVGPDNGLLGWAAEALGGARDAVVLDRRAWHGARVSRTFHGRDIFAPVAARLAAGAPLDQAGTPLPVTELVTLADPVCRGSDGQVEVEVLTVDGFGNVALAAGTSILAELGNPDEVTVTTAGRDVVVTVGETFDSVPAGDLVLYVDSADLVTLAVNTGSAAQRLGTGAGDLVRLTVPAF